MPIPFVGGDAIAAGVLTRAQLRHRYRPIFHGIYVPRDHRVTLRDRIHGAALAVPTGVIGGVAASAVHGAKWVDEGVPIDLLALCKGQRGLVVRHEVLAYDEVVTIGGVRVTSRARTAFDLARHLPRDLGVARLDALMNAAPFGLEDVHLLAKRHRGARGLTRLRKALPLVDGGAESPRETRLRLLFIDAGLPWPTTQYVVRNEFGQYVRRIDMCWEEFKVGAEYDGAQHLTDRRQYSKDVWANRELQRLKWHVVHVIKEDHGNEIVQHARSALLDRGWSGLP
ncbi:hypothetical protein ACNO8X_07910 [Mycobacterium sp. PDNC021]|uniref:hypothetical protein n=1 Tax=Mycobacterium sp. PDNC021 TaxID=3391399 RepID=UPI003AAAA45E